MIWIFKVDETFWREPSKVNQYYVTEYNDINKFNIFNYGITIYAATSNYFLLEDSNPDKIYRAIIINREKDSRLSEVLEGTFIYDVIKQFYTKQNRENKLNQLINSQD